MYILTLNCDDKPGVVAAVATALADAQCNIEESAQFHDIFSNRFFMRVVFSPLTKGAEEKFTKDFDRVSTNFSMQWQIVGQNKPIKTMLLVSKEDHCLNDLLYRARTQHLNIEITAIASNHEVCRPLAERYDLPYHHLPITSDTKTAQESQLQNLIEDTGSELIILARYMQILSPAFCTHYHGRVINIHHSFLPGFKGAKPYHQAYERGVKIIGATAHFATPDLDEEPIIAQDVVPITHSHNPRDLQALGRDTESRVLAQAIKLYSESRIFLHAGRTVIL